MLLLLFGGWRGGGGRKPGDRQMDEQPRRERCARLAASRGVARCQRPLAQGCRRLAHEGRHSPPTPHLAPPTHVCVLCRLARKELKNWLTSTVLFSNNHLL